MFWETLSAILFLLVLFPLWLPVSTIWGLINFILTIAEVAKDDLSNIFHSAIFAGAKAIEAFLSIPEWLWEWAKYEQPWWALFISIFVYWLYKKA